jgi:hypothetical protein
VLFALVFSIALVVQSGTVFFSLKLRGELSIFDALLRSEVERRSTPGEEGGGRQAREVGGLKGELGECLDDIFFADSARSRTLAMNELATLAHGVVDKSRAARSSLPRLPLLSGAGAAIFILSLGVFARESWPWAGASMASGVLCSFVSAFVGRAGSGSSKRIRSLLELLSEQLDRRSRQEQMRRERSIEGASAS